MEECKMEERTFTYGDQFSPHKMSLKELLDNVIKCGNDRIKLQKSIAKMYFAQSGSQSIKMAMNSVLSMNSYKLIELNNSGKKYKITELGDNIHRQRREKDSLEMFVKHILLELEGITLLKLIEDMHLREEEISLESIAFELNEMGIKIAPNATYISTMKAWLNTCEIFKGKRGYDINWDRVKEIIGIQKDLLDELYQLSREQKYFLMSMINLDARDFIKSNGVAEYVRSVYRIKITSKTLVKSILEPLGEKGLILISKSTSGRGAKPHFVKLAKKIISEVYEPIIESISNKTRMTTISLNKPFKDVVEELNSNDKSKKGIALELLSIWIIRLLGLHFSGWRVRSRDTGGGEVDVLAANDKIVYSRWQIQCKNTSNIIGVEVISKEIGITFLTEADIVMIVTTSRFSGDALYYANKVMSSSRYYIILLDGSDIERIIKDKTMIVDILNKKAEKVYFVKELIN